MASNITNPITNKQRQMVWDEQKNIVLCQQILAERPYHFKKWSNERTKTWNMICEINPVAGPIAKGRLIK